ncbi:MAG: hypothetical protein LAO79_18955, partial [Acidobacteriia bacterium]|nr:hypothetical protein [Terriglobia bacterium]
MAREAVDPAEVRGAFLKLLDLSAADRDAFLEQLPPQIRNEVEALLASEQGAETMLRGIVSGAGIHQAVSGEKFGVFRITALVGRGGMGAVYQAERDDGEISQTVAIKVIERGWLDPRALERFRQERQILAGLMHPNIAR